MSLLVMVVISTMSPAADSPVPPKAVAPKGTPKTLTVFPPQIDLSGPRSHQQIGVLATYANGQQWDLTREATLTSADPTRVRVDAKGGIQGLSDGATQVVVRAAGLTTTIPVQVRDSSGNKPVAFASEVVPILTKTGCNQGACHGAQHGRGGFKLSLLGFDPAFDHAQIVQSAEGRRIVLSDPERSILLQKPILVMEHGGGERLTVESEAYSTIKRWLEDGAPEPEAKPPIVTSLEVWPKARIAHPGEQQTLLVRARWSNGHVDDVTALAQFDSLNEGVAAVTPSGLVTAKGKGETHVMVRFAGQATVARLTLPYAAQGDLGDFRPANFLDAKLANKWRDLGLTPSPLASDAEFFRRLHLDVLGTLPEPETIRAFLADSSAEKRLRAIEQVLERPEFIDYWALKWGDLLRINRAPLEEKGMWSFHNWVRSALRDRRPVDEFVRDIVTAEGSTFTEGPANYYRLSRDPLEWSETTAQIFLGVRMQCAKCHHHPFEKWSQDDYYGLAAFFVRLRTKQSQEFGLFGRETIVHLQPTGEQTHPRKGGVVKPRPLDGSETEDPFDRRRKLADWITATENPFFARNIVNRFWGYLMGRGLVEPLDDMRATNPASNPELLDALAADFVASKYDLRHLLKTILSSRAYQLSSKASPGNVADTANIHHTRYTVKRIGAEAMADALDFATGTREKYPGLPPGTRAIQLPDTSIRSYLMDVFGRPARQITCECERTAQPNIAQALHLLNGNFLNQKINAATGRIETLTKAKKPIPEGIEELYLVTLSRPPQGSELVRAQEWIARAPTPREGMQDLLWVLLNSSEFLFNH